MSGDIPDPVSYRALDQSVTPGCRVTELQLKLFVLPATEARPAVPIQGSPLPATGSPNPVKHKSNMGHGNPWSLVPESSCVASGNWDRQEPDPSASPHPPVGSVHVPAAAVGTPWITAAPGCKRMITRRMRPRVRLHLAVFSFFFVETGSLYIALDILEFIM